jgi:hypothetical protein
MNPSGFLGDTLGGDRGYIVMALRFMLRPGLNLLGYLSFWVLGAKVECD